MNDQLHPLFAKILTDAARRPDVTPHGSLPVIRDLPPPPTCERVGCESPASAGGYCSRGCWKADERKAFGP